MQNNPTPHHQSPAPQSLDVHTKGQQQLTPIHQLSPVTVESKSAFFSDLKAIELIVDAVPLLLKNDRPYVLRLDKDGVLEISCPSRGIEQYGILPGGAPLTQLTETPEGTLLTFQTPDGLRTVLIKRDATSGATSSSYSATSYDRSDSYATNRKTSPWRKTSYDDDDDKTCSESHGGCGGER